MFFFNLVVVGCMGWWSSGCPYRDYPATFAQPKLLSMGSYRQGCYWGTNLLCLIVTGYILSVAVVLTMHM